MGTLSKIGNLCGIESEFYCRCLPSASSIGLAKKEKEAGQTKREEIIVVQEYEAEMA